MYRWTSDDFAAIPASNFKLLPIFRTAATDRPPATAVNGLTISSTHPLLAVPVTTHLAASPTARSAHHAGHTAPDGAPTEYGHVQSYTLRVRGKCHIPTIYLQYIILSCSIPRKSMSTGEGEIKSYKSNHPKTISHFCIFCRIATHLWKPWKMYRILD